MKIVKEFIAREIAGEYVLVPTGATTQEFNGLITLSETAKFIWDQLEKVDSFNSLVEAIVEEYEIDKETAAQDATDFLNSLAMNGFIECTKEDKVW